MTSAASRWKRIVRVRAVEHRIAQQRLADADNRLNYLNQISERIDNLRAKTRVNAGHTDGQTLAALSEMATRLDSARDDMTAPVDEALQQRGMMDARRSAAWVREESASRLFQRSTEYELAQTETRADANRPARNGGKSISSMKRKNTQ